MKRLFISQPMRDKTDEQILAERERAIKEAKEMIGEDVEVIDSFFKEAPHDAKPLWYLAKSLELLLLLMWLIFVLGGNCTGDVRLNTLVLLSIALIELNQRKVKVIRFISHL